MKITVESMEKSVLSAFLTEIFNKKNESPEEGYISTLEHSFFSF